MSQPPDSDHARRRERLQKAGLRATAARLWALRRLERAERPLSAVEAHDAPGGESFDRVTIYRTLHALVDAGLASRVDAGDRLWRFALKTDDRAAGHAGHPHLLCDDCGAVVCLEDASIRVEAAGAPRQEVRISQPDVYLHGSCGACAP